MKILIVLMVLSVAIILGFGLSNMMKNGDISRSQRLMRLRVGGQFIVIIVVMTLFYIFSK